MPVTERDMERQRLVSRRALILGGGQLALFGALIGRMYYLQVEQADRYATLADENRINLRLLPPTRGKLLDRFGEPIAVNNQDFRVTLVAEQAGEVAETLGKLTQIVPMTDDEIARVLRDVRSRQRFVPVTVRNNLSWDQVSQIEVNAPELPGISIDVGDLRSYPHGAAGVHAVGYVGAVAEEDLTGDPLLGLPDFKIGKTGAERQFEGALRGSAGTSQVEVNAVGRVIREIDRDDGTAGSDVELTLDIGLQQAVQERLNTEYSASVVVLDVDNGEIYALANHPAYDPNLFARGISTADWRRLINDMYSPLSNKAISGQYAPGSTFKMLVALAALEAGEIGPGYEVYCPGHMDLGNHRFHCWKRGGHGSVDIVQAIAQSCDTFFYDLSLKIGVDAIADMARRFGLGEVPDIDLPGGRSGLIPTRAWKQATLGEPWQGGETLIASIGQGYVLSTPLQLAVMTARMVNGGKAIVPHLGRRIGGVLNPLSAQQQPDIGVNPRHLDLMVDSMIEVTEGQLGTARTSAITEAGWEMGGKTGTSQVRRISAAERLSGIIPNEERPWRLRDHALFVGFAPIHKPRYAVSVVVEHGGGGSAVAAPIARDVLMETQRRRPGELDDKPLAAAVGDPVVPDGQG